MGTLLIPPGADEVLAARIRQWNEQFADLEQSGDDLGEMAVPADDDAEAMAALYRAHRKHAAAMFSAAEAYGPLALDVARAQVEHARERFAAAGTLGQRKGRRRELKAIERDERAVRRAVARSVKALPKLRERLAATVGSK